MSKLGGVKRLKKLLKEEAPTQEQAVLRALAEAARTGNEHSVVGSADFGPVGRVTSGERYSVTPDAANVGRARRTNAPLFDFHTHPSDNSTFGVEPSFTDLAYYASNYWDRPGISDRRVRAMIATPPNRGLKAATGYHMFETDEPGRVFNDKLARSAQYELQRAAGKGKFSSVLDGPAFADFMDYGGDPGDLVGDMSVLTYLARQAQKGLGRQELGLSGRLVTPGLRNDQAYRELQGSMLDFLTDLKFKEGGAVKNFKPQTHAPKGALCACKDKLGPHYLTMADGGSVPSADDVKLWDLPALIKAYLSRPDSSKPGAMSDEAYDERLLGPRRTMRPTMGGRRPEALNASRGVNVPGQLLRGWAAGTAGLPGDIESLVRMAIPGASNTPTLPTSEFYQEWLPGRDARPAAQAAGGAGSLAGGVGAGKVARGVQKVAAPVAKGALATIARGMEGQGPFSGLVAPSAPAFAVRPRGGNFVNPDISDLGGWIPENLDNRVSPSQAWADKVLRNYVKRDLGAPTDPLLALEKELPGLHLGAERLANDGGDVARLYRARERGREFPRLLEPNNREVGSLEARGATNMLNRHEELSGNVPLSYWGRVSDAEVLETTAGKELADDLAGKWPLSMMYPDRAYPDSTGLQELEGLLRHTDNMIGRFDSPEGRQSPLKRQKLAEYRQKIVDAMANDWRAKKPDDPMYSLVGGAGERLGFDHIMDYIEAATDPYTRFKKLTDIGAQTPAEKKQVEETYKRLVKDLEGKPFDEAWNGEMRMLPYRQDEVREWFALRDAGLLVDPASLDRMSVPDMVKKVAKWNEYMEAKKGVGEAEKLMKGARVFKEYGADAGPSAGMKWVEFGQQEDGKFFTPETLPEGWKLEEFDRGGDVGAKHYAIVSGGKTLPTLSGSMFNTPEDALTTFTDEFHRANISEGLKAEGDAMGHCVGGYCDDVATRGTKIYSLRDSKGQPHVTIEVRPKSTGAYLRAPVDNEPDFERFLESYDEVERLLPIEARAAWEDLNGPNSDAEKAINWLKTTQPTVYEKVFAPKPELEIVQIKGKGNQAPAAKYLPAVQDFVRSQQWGRVGDLRNTGLLDFTKGATSNFRVGPNRELIQAKIPPGYHSPEDIQRILMEQGVPEAEARSHAGNFGGQRYAKGGIVRANEPDGAPGFLPRTFEEAVDYAEHVYRMHGA